MGVQMPRRPGGAKSKTAECVHGSAGERGMGSQYSGGKNKSNTLSWKNPSKSVDKTKSKSTGGMKTQPNRYQKITHNPSGASNVGMGYGLMSDYDNE
jgi:hypothetical protein